MRRKGEVRLCEGTVKSVEVSRYKIMQDNMCLSNKVIKKARGDINRVDIRLNKIKVRKYTMRYHTSTFSPQPI